MILVATDQDVTFTPAITYLSFFAKVFVLVKTLIPWANHGLIDFAGTETFAKELK